MSNPACAGPSQPKPLGPAASALDGLWAGRQWQRFVGDPDRGSDDFAGDHQLHAAILLASLRVVIRRHGLRLAKSPRSHRRRGNVFFGEVITDGIGSLFGELLVHGIAAYAVGVAFESKPEV